MESSIARRESVSDRLANELIRRIVSGDYAPGIRLPPERTLAVELGSDRTSLRIALAQVKRLNLLSIVQGSGAVVNDYRTHAGVEFFLHAFALADTPDEPALLNEMLQYFHLTMPGVYGLVMQRASDADLAAIEGVYRRQVAARDPEASAALAVEAIDEAAIASRNLIFQAIFRSMRPLRLRLMRRLMALVDIRHAAEDNVRWVQLLRSRTLSADEVEERYRATLRRSHVKAREAMGALAQDAWGAAPRPGAAPRLGVVVSPVRPRRPPTTPDRLAHELMRRIWLGAYAPGQHLSPERELAVELGTDRTSLRVALGQLKRMNLISAVQGSGMAVKDFRRDAGIDFLEHVFELEDTPLEAEMLAQVADYLNATVPALVGLCARLASPPDLERLEHVFRQARAAAGDVEAVSELTVRSEDMFAAATGNVVVALVYHSTRPLRLRLAHRVAATTDMRQRLDAHLDFLRIVQKGLVAVDDVEGLFRTYQRKLFSDARAALTGAGGSAAPAA